MKKCWQQTLLINAKRYNISSKCCILKKGKYKIQERYKSAYLIYNKLLWHIIKDVWPWER